MKSSAIEGQRLNPKEVRSIAGKLGLDAAGLPTPGRDVAGVVEMMFSMDTVLRDICELLERGIVIKNEGGGRSTSYRLATPDEVRVR